MDKSGKNVPPGKEGMGKSLSSSNFQRLGGSTPAPKSGGGSSGGVKQGSGSTGQSRGNSSKK